MQVQVLSIQPAVQSPSVQAVIKIEGVVHHFDFEVEAVELGEDRVYVTHGDTEFERRFTLLPGLHGAIGKLVNNVFLGQAVHLPLSLDDSQRSCVSV